MPRFSLHCSTAVDGGESIELESWEEGLARVVWEQAKVML